MKTQQEQFIHIDKYGNRFHFSDEKITVLHRLDGPTIVYTDGTKEWYVNGKLHRLDGPAIEGLNGYKEWFVDGKLHRLDGPAVECSDGYKGWWVEGKRHRLDGPACEYPDGPKRWFVNGKVLTEAAFIALTAPKPVELTIDQIAEKFGISVEQLKIIK